MCTHPPTPLQMRTFWNDKHSRWLFPLNGGCWYLNKKPCALLSLLGDIFLAGKFSAVAGADCCCCVRNRHPQWMNSVICAQTDTMRSAEVWHLQRDAASSLNVSDRGAGGKEKDICKQFLCERSSCRSATWRWRTLLTSQHGPHRCWTPRRRWWWRLVPGRWRLSRSLCKGSWRRPRENARDSGSCGMHLSAPPESAGCVWKKKADAHVCQ